jgi:ABC-2 type transport system ATP-binding protein
MLTVESLTKEFGSVRAVDDLSFTVAPGRVTGFLGPNGAGKTTTLRCLLGLVSPTSGRTLIAGRAYRDLPDPTHTVGASLEASGFHPGRTARDHLRILARAGGVEPSRVDVVLDQVGLADAANRRAGGFSLGMRQRLALASALLGDPDVLVLDEPANGLDPEGIAWLRQFLRYLAAEPSPTAPEGRTILVSSHVLAEVEQTVDDVVIIARGRLVTAGSLADLVAGGDTYVLVRTPQSDQLGDALRDALSDVLVQPHGDALRIAGASAPEIGRIALAAGVELHELTPQRTDLEDLFIRLTSGAAA